MFDNPSLSLLVVHSVMPTLTPPSSSATTPVRPSSPTPRMDVDSPAAPLSPAAESGSATPAEEQIPAAAQKQPQQLSTPKLSNTENEGEEVS